MKILHIITSLKTGGAEKLMVDLLPLLKQDGYDVSLAIMNPERTPFYHQLEKSGVKIIDMKWKGSYYNPLYIFQFIKLIKNFDIVHAHLATPQLFSAFSSVVCSVALYATEHSTNNRRRGCWWYRKIDRWVYNRYKVITCVSDGARQNLISHIGNVKAKIITVENGINLTKYMNAVELNGMKDPSKIVLVMVGSLREQKDQDTIMRALALLPRNTFELWLVGDGDRKKTLEELSRDLGVEQEVKFLGIRFDVPQILRTADLAVMSSHWEGFGLAAVEAMAAGLPVIASNVPGLASVVDGYGLLFKPGDAKDLADKILTLWNNEIERERVVSLCKQRAKIYDIQTMKEKFEEIYTSL